MYLSFRPVVFVIMFLLTGKAYAQGKWLANLKSPIVFKGDEKTAYRDPAILYHEGILYLFFSLYLIANTNKTEKRD